MSDFSIWKINEDIFRVVKNTLKEYEKGFPPGLSPCRFSHLS